MDAYTGSLGILNKQIYQKLRLRALASLVARLTTLVAYNRVRTIMGKMTRLLALVADGIVFTVSRLVSRLLAASANHLIRTIAEQMSVLQTVIATRHPPVSQLPNASQTSSSPTGSSHNDHAY